MFRGYDSSQALLEDIIERVKYLRDEIAASDEVDGEIKGVTRWQRGTHLETEERAGHH